MSRAESQNPAGTDDRGTDWPPNSVSMAKYSPCEDDPTNYDF